MRLFDRGVHFVRGLVDQERATGDQDEIFPGEIEAEGGNGRLGEADDPADDQQQQNAEDQGQRQAELAGPIRLLLGEAGDQHRDEHDIVDPQHDLHDRQGTKSDPGVWIGQ